MRHRATNQNRVERRGTRPDKTSSRTEQDAANRTSSGSRILSRRGETLRDFAGISEKGRRKEIANSWESVILSCRDLRRLLSGIELTEHSETKQLDAVFQQFMISAKSTCWNRFCIFLSTLLLLHFFSYITADWLSSRIMTRCRPPEVVMLSLV